MRITGTAAAQARLPAEFKEDMINFHLALPKVRPDIHQAIERGSAIGWVRTRHEDYVVFIDMRKAEAAARRAR